jgi:hypothetical protein
MFMKKRGTSHIEMILAFILFLGVLASIFIFFNPFKDQSLNTQSAQHLSRVLKNLASVNVTSITIIINTSSTIPKAPTQFGINLSEAAGIFPLGNRCVIKNGSGNFLPGNFSKNILYTMWDDENGTTFFITCSENLFDASVFAITCTSANINPLFFRIASFYSNTIVSEKKMMEFQQAYLTSYEGLRNMTGLSPEQEFGFFLTIPPDTILYAKKDATTGTDVVVAQQPVEVLRLNQDRAYASLEVFLW